VSYWNAPTLSEQSTAVRLLRLVDAMVPLGRRVDAAASHRASYFVRLTLPNPLWRQHRRRIVRDARALRDDDALHFWFHPHNIGGDPLRGVARLAELLDEVREAAPHTIEFMSMSDVADRMGGETIASARQRGA
jgi:hypothetical protein